MGIFDIPQIGEVISIAKKVVGICEIVLKNTDLKEKWQTEGRAPFKFSVYDYNVSVVIEDKRKTAIPAEVIKPHKEYDNSDVLHKGD